MKGIVPSHVDRDEPVHKPPTQLPQWLEGEESREIERYMDGWWATVKGWLELPFTQLDPLTCALGALHLLAWSRKITRFEGEPLEGYRRRVFYAYPNAIDGGNAAGFKRIFERLGINDVQIYERVADRDWDVIQITLDEQKLADYDPLLRVLIDTYGRTCRRYEYLTETRIALGMTANEFNHSWHYDRTEL